MPTSPDLDPEQRQLLQSIADAPEGKVLPAESRTIWLEFHDLVRSQAEPDRRDMDRWTITDKGREVLARYEEQN